MNNNQDNKVSFDEKHPKLNIFISWILVFIIIFFAIVGVYWIIIGLKNFATWLSTLVSSLEAVIFVALISGGLSFIGLMVSKIIDYKKSRNEYLAQKREEPYGEFVDMIYKLQQNSKNKHDYTEEEMIKDLSKFSKQITLWGSSSVVKNWVKFRENGANPDEATNNLFLLEKIMNGMRKDLGLRKVKKGNLLAFFINDIKSAMKNK